MLSLAADVCENLSTTHSKHLMYLDAGTEFDQALATSKLAKKLEKAFTPVFFVKKGIQNYNVQLLKFCLPGR